jgi:hypothetical protein
VSPPRRLLNALLLALAVSVLAGCFRSDKPLIEVAQAAFPFEELTVKTEDGEIAILRKEASGYAYIDPEKPAKPGEKPILLHQVADDLYVIQEAAENSHAIYLFARRERDKITVSSLCRAIDEAVLTRLGIERESGGGELADCVVKDLKSLTELAKTPDLWANETKTLEIVSIK